MKDKIKAYLGRHSTLYTAITIILLVYLVYLFGTGALSSPLFFDNTDPITYNNQAAYFAENNQLTDDYWPFGYYFLLGILYKIFGSNYFIGKMLNIVLLLGICLIILDLLRRKKLFNVKNTSIIFLIFTTFVLIDPEIRYYTITLYKEIGVAFFALLTLYLYTLYSPKKLWYNILMGVLVAIVGMIGAQFNAWFIAPLFFGLIWISLDFKGIRETLDKTNKNIPFILSFIIAFFVLSLLFANLYEHSTGNRHVFPNNGAVLLFSMNAPTGCEGVTFTLDNNACIPNEDFMIPYATDRGLDYEELDQFEKAKLQQSYVVSFILSNPGKTMERIIPFLDLWVIPSTRESQRIISNESGLKNYLWITFILAVAGLIALLIRKEAGIEWLWILVFYAFATFAYLMTYYLMRYRIYFKFFELLLASYFIYIVISYFVKDHTLRHIFSRKMISNKIIAILIIIGLVTIIFSLSPLMQFRNQTSYMNVLSGLVGEEVKIEVFNPDLADRMGVIVTEDCTGLLLSIEPYEGTVLSQGLVEYYPLGQVLRNENELKEWAIKRARTFFVRTTGDISRIRGQDGMHEYTIYINGEMQRIPLMVLNGLVLSPEYANYYVTTCN
jgi:hypothetical protein